MLVRTKCKTKKKKKESPRGNLNSGEMSEKVRKKREENMCEEIVYSFPSWAVDQRSAQKAVFPTGVGIRPRLSLTGGRKGK